MVNEHLYGLRIAYLDVLWKGCKNKLKKYSRYQQCSLEKHIKNSIIIRSPYRKICKIRRIGAVSLF